MAFRHGHARPGPDAVDVRGRSLLPGAQGAASRSSGTSALGSATAAADQSGVAAPTADWTPQAAIYGTGALRDLPVTMSDGTVLRVDVFFPVTPGTTAAAPGPFPVLLQQTPYGKDAGSVVPARSVAGAPAGLDHRVPQLLHVRQQLRPGGIPDDLPEDVAEQPDILPHRLGQRGASLSLSLFTVRA